MPVSSEKKITLDLEASTVIVESASDRKTYALGTAEAFEAISRAWLRVGWDAKHVYSFTWFGRPMIQLPEDMIRLQEVIFAVRPDVIIETGVAHGGSLVFYATLCKAMDRGRVIGIDIEIRPHNREAIEAHPLFSYITLIEGSSADPEVINKVRAQLKPDQTVLVLLDSMHTEAHVRAELEGYSPFVTKNSYIVAMDGIMGELPNAPRTMPEWSWNNPRTAALEFVAEHPNFIIEEPAFLFNEGAVNKRVTYWPSAFIKRVA